MWRWGRALLAVGCAVAVGLTASNVQAQTFAIDLHNNLMPASGGMAGASLSRPQDLQSAINGNPATLRQFQRTQFSFGGYAFEATDTFAATIVNISGNFWVGFGTTWRFGGRASNETIPVQ